MAAARTGGSRASDVIKNWIRNRSTLEYLGTWEELYNPDFKVFKSEHFKKEAGLVTFTPSVSEWVEQTDAIGLYVKKGRYGGTFAHKDIALFGFTAKAWREANPELAKNSNVRDYASINELTVLSNLETHNAQMIREGKEKKDRFEVLQDIAKYQMGVLNEAARIEQKGGIEIETTGDDQKGDENYFGQSKSS